MTSFFDEISRNRLRSVMLMALFSLIFFVFIYLFVEYLGGGPFAMVIGGIVIIGYALFSYLQGSKVVLAISHAKKASKKDYPSLFSAVEGLSSASQIPMPEVYVINDPNPNAFATGRDRKHASVAVTSGLLSMMDKNELQGVIAHEISHIYDNDIQFMMLAVVFAGVIGLLAVFIRTMFWFGAGGRRNGNGIILIVALVMSFVAPIIALLVRLAISRRREYMADANGARITRSPASLASALQKIQAYDSKPNAPPVAHANDMTAPLYFSNPLKKESFTNLFSTHPPITERIKRLKEMY